MFTAFTRSPLFKSKKQMTEILSITDIEPKSFPSLGERGEKVAVDHLIKKGYRIVVTNFTVPVGRNSKGVAVTGEIDIIALDGETLVFVEVKTRSSEEFTPVITAVDRRKQRQITRTAKIYRRIFDMRDVECRYDVITVLMPKGEKPEVELVKGFWSEGKFKKRSWGNQIWQDFV